MLFISKSSHILCTKHFFKNHTCWGPLNIADQSHTWMIYQRFENMTFKKWKIRKIKNYSIWRTKNKNLFFCNFKITLQWHKISANLFRQNKLRENGMISLVSLKILLTIFNGESVLCLYSKIISWDIFIFKNS